MGLDTNGIRFLLYSKQLGVDFSRTAMIGRQSLHVNKHDLARELASFGYRFEARELDSIMVENDGYAEPLLRYLGATEVHSFDCSQYEGATHQHDMNQPLPGKCKEQYTTVLDGGSLEHIFNFPVAIKNCMEMLKIGGYYLAITPANNFVGHGFYQFSPELYFSVFTPANGFKIIRVLAFENMKQAKWYSVKNPLALKRRVTLTNSVPVYLVIIARKLACKQIFETIPQQSDYLSLWHEEETGLDCDESNRPQTTLKYLHSAKRVIPKPIKRMLCCMLLRGCALVSGSFHPAFFLPIDITKDREPPRKQ